jgi:hypothetical protein
MTEITNQLIAVKCTYQNGDTIDTMFNGTLQDAENYFLNKVFNIGNVKDNLQKCIKVDEITDDEPAWIVKDYDHPRFWDPKENYQFWAGEAALHYANYKHYLYYGLEVMAETSKNNFLDAMESRRKKEYLNLPSGEIHI